MSSESQAPETPETPANEIEWLGEPDLDGFVKSGLVWFVNRWLHLFGWALVYQTDSNSGAVLPDSLVVRRCRYRGYSEQDEIDGFKKVTAYLNDNAGRLVEDCEL